MLEHFVQGMGSHFAVTESIFTAFTKELLSDPSVAMKKARLAAIFALKASQVFEQVVELRLGPLADGKLHVLCEGRRRDRYANQQPTVFRIEGDYVANAGNEMRELLDVSRGGLLRFAFDGEIITGTIIGSEATPGPWASVVVETDVAVPTNAQLSIPDLPETGGCGLAHTTPANGRFRIQLSVGYSYIDVRTMVAKNLEVEREALRWRFSAPNALRVLSNLSFDKTKCSAPCKFEHCLHLTREGAKDTELGEGMLLDFREMEYCVAKK